MPALGSPSTWRTHPQSHRGYLFIDKPAIVFKALVNMATITFPLREITFDTVATGSYSDIKEGMTLLLGSTEGDDDLGRTAVRVGATSDTIFIGQTSRGTHDGELDVVDDAYITIVDDHRVWAKIPRIQANGVIWKWGGESYTSGNPAPPVALINRGMGEAGFVDSGTILLTVSLDASGSYAVADGASIATYNWDVGDGSITVGSSSSSAITATFPAGRRWISLLVTDDNGQATTRWYLIAACEKTGSNAPIMNFDVTEHTHRPEGQQMSFRVFEAIAESTYPDGAAVIYWEEEVYNGTTTSLPAPSGVEHVKFTGWIQTEDADIKTDESGILTETTLRCLDVAGRLSTLPGFDQIVERDASPANWLEMADAHMDRYLHFLIAWHSTALDVADFTWSGTGDTYSFSILGSGGASLYDQLDSRAQAIAHRFTCDRVGRLWVKPDPQLQDSGDRTSTVIVDIDETDWTDIRYTRTRPPRAHWLKSSAVVAGTTEADAVTTIGTVFAVSPGKAPGQGVSSQQYSEQLVVDQDELNSRTGHRYATRLNAKFGYFEVELAHGNDGGIDPSYMEWVRLTISADNAAQRGLTFTDERFLLIEVRTAHNEDGTKDVSLVIERESEGIPAATVIQNTAGTFVTQSSGIPLNGSYSIDDGEQARMASNQDIIAGVNTDGYLYQTTEFMTPSYAGGPGWIRQNLSMSGTPLQFVVDAFSYGTGQVDGWVFTTTNIYKVSDILGTSPSASSQHTFATAIGSDDRLNADGSFGEDGFVSCVISYNATGVGTVCVHTTNGGSTWTETTITAYSDNDTNYDHMPMLFVSSRIAGKILAGASLAISSTNYSGKTADSTVAPPGTSTGVTVNAGEIVTITSASGLWRECTTCSYSGADGAGYTTAGLTVPDGEVATLIARVGTTGDWYEVKSDGSFVSPTTGTLYLAMNDIGSYGGNNGSLTVAFDVANGTVVAGRAYQSDDYGATWALTSPLVTLGSGLGGSLDVPYADNLDEAHWYYGHVIATPPTAQTFSLYRHDGTTATDITPDTGDSINWFPVQGRWALKTSPTDRYKLLFCAYGESSDGGTTNQYCVLTTADGGATWVRIVDAVTGTATYLRGAIAGDNSNVLYLWGGEARIGYSTDFGLTIDDRRGNITSFSSPTPGTFIGIAGGG